MILVEIVGRVNKNHYILWFFVLTASKKRSVKHVFSAEALVSVGIFVKNRLFHAQRTNCVDIIAKRTFCD